MSIVFAICESVRPGESSVAERACELLEGLELAIPYTTRLPRSADDHGFVFASRDVFERLVASQEFLEYQNVFGNYYGTPRRCLQEAEGNSNDLLIKVDGRGVAQIKQKLPDAVSILVLHISSGRHEHATGSIGGELLRHQLQKASRLFQMQNADKFDHVVANDALEETVNEVAAIIRSERSRRS